jgi:hypothetical protein
MGCSVPWKPSVGAGERGRSRQPTPEARVCGSAACRTLAHPTLCQGPIASWTSYADSGRTLRGPYPQSSSRPGFPALGSSRDSFLAGSGSHSHPSRSSHGQQALRSWLPPTLAPDCQMYPDAGPRHQHQATEAGKWKLGPAAAASPHRSWPGGRSERGRRPPLPLSSGCDHDQGQDNNALRRRLLTSRVITCQMQLGLSDAVRQVTDHSRSR